MGNAIQHQRKKAAKAARRKAVVAGKKKAEATSLSTPGRVRLAATCPVACCLVPTNLFDTGIGSIVIARMLPNGLLACAFFLVDVYCLGVKDVIYRDMEPERLEEYLTRASEEQDFDNSEPSRARKLIRDAVAYAAGVGLEPAAAHKVIEPIFGNADADACTETFTFGRDGKPFFVNGPKDTPARIRQISNILNERCGPGGWEFMIGEPGGEEFERDDEEDDEEEEESGVEADDRRKLA